MVTVWVTEGSPVFGFAYLFTAVILWLKLISYAHCNRDLRLAWRERALAAKEKETQKEPGGGGGSGGGGGEGEDGTWRGGGGTTGGWSVEGFSDAEGHSSEQQVGEENGGGGEGYDVRGFWWRFFVSFVPVLVRVPLGTVTHHTCKKIRVGGV